MAEKTSFTSATRPSQKLILGMKNFPTRRIHCGAQKDAQLLHRKDAIPHEAQTGKELTWQVELAR
jgi:hypothetical protein